MPLHLEIDNAVQRRAVRARSGPLEFGRGPHASRSAARSCGDPTVSRDQLRIEERPGGRLRVENLSRRTPVVVPGRGQIAELQSQELDLPLLLTMGQTKLSIELRPPPATRASRQPAAGNDDRRPAAPGAVVDPGALPGSASQHALLGLASPSAAGSAAEQIGLWLQRVIELQQTGAGSPEFYGKTAQALVDLVGMDLGLVLLRARRLLVHRGQRGGLGHDQRALQQDALESRGRPAEDLLRGPQPVGRVDVEPGGPRVRRGRADLRPPGRRGGRALRRACPARAGQSRVDRAAWRPNWCNSWRRPWGPTWRGRRPSGRGCSSSSSSRRTWSASSSAIENCWKAGPTR